MKSRVTCAVCGSSEWMRLPDPSSLQSVTTAGSILREPLGKSQCIICGLVQRTDARYLGLSDFYEQRYTAYYDRPGTEIFNSSRYAEIAQWVLASIGEHAPKSILEVGCGRGWTLRAIRNLSPSAELAGLEPSVVNSEEARKLGFEIHTRKLDRNDLPARKYDLVFSNHVLQHTTDPLAFLEAMRELVADKGLIVITVQDSTIPTNELLYSDQNFSFLPYHLTRLSEAARLKVLAWIKPPDTDSLRFSQLIVCCKKTDDFGLLHGTKVPDPEPQTLKELFLKRVDYLESWHRIEQHLVHSTTPCRHIYNFGAGMYSYLLACYCEQYWTRVESCTVDNCTGEFFGKQVVPLHALQPDNRDCVVLGTRPGLHSGLGSRLSALGWKTISWENFVIG
jgi:SAM-dependent methyltransferase